MTEAYPLKWPQGWPRHKGRRDSDRRFYGPTFKWDRVYRGIREELKRIGATHIVVSTDQPLRQDGYPYSQVRRIDDPGVAVYFMRRKKPMVMAQDRFDTVMGNMRSLTMAIEGLRQMERHGGAVMLEKAFSGFAALPAPPSCWDILGMNPASMSELNREGIMAKFRAAARAAANTGADMDRIVKARDEALEKFGA